MTVQSKYNGAGSDSKNNTALTQVDILNARRAETRTYNVAAGPADPRNNDPFIRKLQLGGNGNDVDGGPVVQKNMLTGRIDKEAFDEATFEQGYKKFMLTGKTVGPWEQESSNSNGGDNGGDVENGVDDGDSLIQRKRGLKKDTSTIKKKRKTKGDASVIDGENAYRGPWASYSASESNSSSSGYSESESESEQELQEAVQQPITIPQDSADESKKEWTEYVGSEEFDYLGRTYMHVPKDLDISLTKESGSQECFVPKQRIHRWNGHIGGVNSLKFFPNSGHILLSGGNDSKIKIWDCHRHNREQLRTIHGHSKAVKDVAFNIDGTRFLSTSYDKTIKLWDTETGKVIRRFKAPIAFGRRNTGNAMANMVRFNPNADESSTFLSAMSDNTVLQWDTRISTNASGSSEANDSGYSSEVVQTYDHHLGAVNSLTFVDGNTRFMSSSDDKRMLVWEWGINVPIKYISDPSQHAMPSVALHPSGKYVAAQSMDNRILVFGATGKFRPNRKKEFFGHQNSGYPISVNFSPDGKYVMSGDANGFAYFWDWKTTQIKGKLKVSQEVVTCIEAHPQETSKVATAGKESTISYWD